MRPLEDIVKEWAVLADEDIEEFLDFAQGLNINEFVTENGVRTIWIENGMYYIAHGDAIRETDSKDAKWIIDRLQECGIEFREVEDA